MGTAHIQCITSVPVLSNLNPNNNHKFYEKLIVSVQALDTMNKSRNIKGYVRHTLDRLPGIRANLFRLDDEWQEWDIPKLVESLRKWILKQYTILRNMRNTNVKMYIR